MEKKIINSKDAPAPVGPYNQAVMAGDTLYISGQIALDPERGEIVKGGIAEETGQVMRNLRAVLQSAGMDYGNVVKCSIFITDMNDFSIVNEVYSSFFSNDSPARETVEVSRLPKDARVEISCIAVK